MSTPVRYDEQYCPIARALDALGDRWTLLILRELSGGERRFTDLKNTLIGVTPAVLTNRLRQLEDQGLITSVHDDAGGRARYSLTTRGRDTQPVMRALARFGMDLLEDPTDAPYVRPWSAVQTCLITYFDPFAADELAVDECYLVRVDGDDTLLSSVRGARGTATKPILTLEIPAADLFALRQQRRTWDDTVQQGRLHVHGSSAAVRRFRRLFRLT